MIYKLWPGYENTVPNALLCIPTYSSCSENDYSSVIAHLVYKSCIAKVPVLLEFIKGVKELLIYALDAIHIALSAGLPVISEKCSKCGAEHLYCGMFVKKHMRSTYKV